MPTHAHETASDVDWTTVSEQHPCAICGAHDRCRRGFADEFACCLRTVSDWPLITGGWVHRLDPVQSEPRPRATVPDLAPHAAMGASWDDQSSDPVRAAS